MKFLRMIFFVYCMFLLLGLEKAEAQIPQNPVTWSASFPFRMVDPNPGNPKAIWNYTASLMINAIPNQANPAAGVGAWFPLNQGWNGVVTATNGLKVDNQNLGAFTIPAPNAANPLVIPVGSVVSTNGGPPVNVPVTVTTTDVDLYFDNYYQNIGFVRNNGSVINVSYNCHGYTTSFYKNIFKTGMDVILNDDYSIIQQPCVSQAIVYYSAVDHSTWINGCCAQADNPNGRQQISQVYDKNSVSAIYIRTAANCANGGGIDFYTIFGNNNFPLGTIYQKKVVKPPQP